MVRDFDAFSDWNPFIRRLSGEPAVGRRLQVTIRPAGRGETTFKPTVVEAEVGRLSWIGRFLMPGLFDGVHTLTVEPRDGGGSTFSQRETFTGVLVPLLSGMLRDTELGFVSMNQALKKRAEAAT